MLTTSHVGWSLHHSWDRHCISGEMVTASAPVGVKGYGFACGEAATVRGGRACGRFDPVTGQRINTVRSWEVRPGDVQVGTTPPSVPPSETRGYCGVTSYGKQEVMPKAGNNCNSQHA